MTSPTTRSPRRSPWARLASTGRSRALARSAAPAPATWCCATPKTGAFEVYDIANNQVTGASSLGSVGLDWQLGGFAADAPGASSAAMGEASQASQLVQAMASFGGASGAADALNVAAVGTDTPQQPLLTAPQHA